MKLWIKTNLLIKALFPKYIWSIPNTENKVWLTFDDGPIAEITEWVLAELRKHNAKATFFCIGDNIKKNPEIFKKLLAEGHAIGNHTCNHLLGWQTETSEYIENVKKCEVEIGKLTDRKTVLFRPPYGKIKRKQSRILRHSGYKIIMWDIVSADFDATITPEKCLKNVLSNVEPGSIIVFHDSVKAFKNLEYVLPRTLAFLSEKGLKCEVLA